MFPDNRKKVHQGTEYHSEDKGEWRNLPKTNTEYCKKEPFFLDANSALIDASRWIYQLYECLSK
jgi:hypothetical protein